MGHLAGFRPSVAEREAELSKAGKAGGVAATRVDYHEEAAKWKEMMSEEAAGNTFTYEPEKAGESDVWRVTSRLRRSAKRKVGPH